MTVDLTPEVEFNLWKAFESVALAVPERDCLIWGQNRLRFLDVAIRAKRLASYIHECGLGVHTERSHLVGHESGQSHLALLLHNCPEYIESMLGAFRSRTVPFNVNYRYSGDELHYLLDDARAEAIIYHARFAPTVAKIRPSLPHLRFLIQLADDSGNSLLPDAVDYENALTSARSTSVPVAPSPDDLYLLYTGGTTGLPKGVLWRQHDIFLAAMGGKSLQTGKPIADLHALAKRAIGRDSFPALAIAPLMHGAAQWASFMVLNGGGTVVFPEETGRVDPSDIWTTVERFQIKSMTVVGDAMARPLLDALERGPYDTTSLVGFGNGGAPMSDDCRQRLMAQIPTAIFYDSLGSSETGAQLSNAVSPDHIRSTMTSSGPYTFAPGAFTTVLDEEITSVVPPGHGGIGWLAQLGNVPLGYLGDPKKSHRTFPVIGGVRYAVPGDRARLLADGSIEVLGRDSATINSGGEKIFAEEVEQALIRHPAVADVVVTGRPSDRWGQEVVALVQLADGQEPPLQELLDEAVRTLARYKLPKVTVFVPIIQRSPSGKADYRWAKEQASLIQSADTSND